MKTLRAVADHLQTAYIQAVEATSKRKKQDICKQCGMCCNGVIFAKLRLNGTDDAQTLQSLLPLKRTRAAAGKAGSDSFHFSQPCAAFCQGKCSIYRQRPLYCREFQCLLLQRVSEREISMESALKKIVRVGRLVTRIEQMLHSLERGSKRKELPLAVRYRKIIAAAEQGGIDPAKAALLSRLSQCMHNLTLRLAEDFYPGGQ